MCFVDADVLLGRGFHGDPAYHWADTLLRSDKLEPDDKAGLLLATACSVYKDKRSKGN
jgi:hypothetical protein